MYFSKPSTSAAGFRPKGKILHSQERSMIFEVYTFLMNCRLKNYLNVKNSQLEHVMEE
jgi:hypothetical protein